MTLGKQAKWAPFKPGDPLVIRHRCAFPDAVVDHVESLRVRRAESRSGYDVGNFKWRVIAERCDGSLLAVYVDHRGLDQGTLIDRESRLAVEA
ncbi:hypothetical protein [Serinibacter salmoneus]|uniref:Uncharacterized protein n=1 Tax=Serinibacter salmoneus TaxID=556530 RepID=A0A2A9D1L7_9MICO|nr:hypothetical protein [Serinibacter salmoneus]PFG19842.1 hypothetical protein ATL40_1418 [Serinibacter salmoneus]